MKTRTTLIISTATLLLSTMLISGNAAAATDCKTVTVTASGSSAGGIAKFRKRRAERRANSAWESNVSKNHGSRYANIDKATIINSTWGQTKRGNTKYTVKASIIVCR